MAKRKTTKRALFMSLMSMILCCAMFIGTTFAWFTDSVTSNNNIIKSGNLDVELEFYDDDAKDWISVGDNTKIFDEDALWEPGRTEVAYLRVRNAGTLALKYQLGVNVVEEKQGINIDDTEFNLSNYIEFDVIETTDENFYTGREAARQAVTESQPISVGYSNESELLPKDDATEDKPYQEYATLIVYMPEEVGNVANYKTDVENPTKNQPYIKLGINLLATQYMYEEDSFGEDYDEDATYDGQHDNDELTAVSNISELITAVTERKSVALTTDVSASESVLYIPTDAEITIDLSGNDLELKEESGLFAMQADSVLNIINSSTEAANIILSESSIGAISGGTVILDNVNVIADSSNGTGIGAYGGTLVVNGSVIDIGNGHIILSEDVLYNTNTPTVFTMNGGEIKTTGSETLIAVGAGVETPGPLNINLNKGAFTANSPTAIIINSVEEVHLNISDDFVINANSVYRDDGPIKAKIIYNGVEQ